MSGMALSYILIIFMCALGVFYIYEVNSLATKGYEIKSLEQKLEGLKKTNEQLNIKAAELKSMYNIEQTTKDLDMVAPNDVSYLNLPGNVAMK